MLLKAQLRLERRDPASTIPDLISLTDKQVVIGRSRQTVDIMLDLPPPAPAYVISRKHLQLRPGDCGNWLISDLGSLNGLSVNGERLESGVELALKHGDLVTIGGAITRSAGDGHITSGGERVMYRFRTLATELPRDEATESTKRARIQGEAKPPAPETPPKGPHDREWSLLNDDRDFARDERDFASSLLEQAQMETADVTSKAQAEQRRADAAETALRRVVRALDAAAFEKACLGLDAETAATIRALRTDGSSDEDPTAMVGAEEDDEQSDDDDDDGDDGGDEEAVCPGCNEAGHAHEQCPYRSDLSDAEEEDEDDT
ncbi:hypothetical protein M885DRAFT_509326 [Pelagophyceae sp. CCMP2097]|nr:hypothetical protein M885DRAFT_509326 [Pelagophyceae sp. CCMP2097]|mmetsp:Transcript_9055/g.31168  ORF Transcript_9055/g.31168 Transcript_9055/m.31168 type:complete len:318 (+) Transcript_9055:217-1170(+)